MELKEGLEHFNIIATTEKQNEGESLTKRLQFSKFEGMNSFRKFLRSSPISRCHLNRVAIISSPSKTLTKFSDSLIFPDISIKLPL